MAPITWTAPSTADVAALIPARVKEPGGINPDDFTANTKPTKGKVENLITHGVREVAKRIGKEVCEGEQELADDATACAALYTAMLVEQGYYPEQTRNAGSSFQSLRSMWTDAIKSLVEAYDERCGGGDGGEAAGGAGQRPRAYFDNNALIGRNNPEW